MLRSSGSGPGMVLATPLRFLAVPPQELSLAAVLKSGQSFRWQRFNGAHATQTGSPREKVGLERGVGDAEGSNAPEEWAMGWGDRTVVLRQSSTGIYYRSLYSFAPPNIAYLTDLKHNTTLPFLSSYFQLDTALTPLYASWAEKDNNFRKKWDKAGKSLEGIRVLKQDPWEALISFICSANNNISRITLMVNRLCERLGAPLPHPCSFHPSSVYTAETLPTCLPMDLPTSDPSSACMFAFPPPLALTPTGTDLLLRELGFGYRAPYVVATSLLLLELAAKNSQTPFEYLDSLSYGKMPLSDSAMLVPKLEDVESDNKPIHDQDNEALLERVREELMKFKGVGRKVADCVALFGLGWKQVVPVDTHVFQIAVRDYAFGLSSKNASLTPLLHNKVAAKLRGIWGSHAGWAQQVLFYADLGSTKSAAAIAQRALSEGGVATTTTTQSTKKRPSFDYEEIPVKAKWEMEVEELMKTPQKRRRTKIECVEVSPPTPLTLAQHPVILKDVNKTEEQEDYSFTAAYPSPISISGSSHRKIKIKATRKRET